MSNTAPETAPVTEEIVEEVVYEDAGDSLKEELKRIQQEKIEGLQESAKRYPALVTMSGALKFVGMIFGIMHVLVAFILLFTAETMGEKIMFFFVTLALGFFFFVFFYFLSEFIEILLSVERNQRNRK